jgi:AraC family transcriptional regulator
MPVVRSVDLPFVRVEYDRVGPQHDGLAITRAGGVGVAFTAQSRAVWQIGGRTFEGSYPATVSLTGGADMVWRRWADVSEAVEFWLDPAWLERISGCKGATQVDPRISFWDPVLHGVASAFCRAMSSDAVSALRFEQLALAAARRILPAQRLERVTRVRPLDERQLRAVDELVEGRLDGAITLEALARETSISIFHFAKRFRATTGTSPYAYVVGRRMSRAMELLRTGRWSVARVAAAVGYGQVGTFRRQFVAHWGQTPGRLEP